MDDPNLLRTLAAPSVFGFERDDVPCVVVAVSGGADSVAMLRILAESSGTGEIRISVAHFDHGTRGEASKEDAAFVADLAKSLGLPFDLGHWSPTRAGHFESDARKARYAWLAKVAKARGASAVAVGHTRDDQAETILHRILRGTGLRGLAGIPPIRELADGIMLVRPILHRSRDFLRGYLAEIGQPFREDATNTDLARTRNRIRHDLLPKIAAEYNPKVAEALVRLGQFASESREWDRRVALHEEAALEFCDAWSIELSVPALEGMTPGLRAEVIRRCWRQALWPLGEMSARRWGRLAQSIGEIPQRFSVGAGVDVSIGEDLMVLSRARPGRLVVPSPLRFDVPGSAVWGDVRIDVVPEDLLPAGFGDERIDLVRVVPWIMGEDHALLEIRAPRAGDRFAPLGLEGRSQSLNDFFRGRDVSKADRAKVPLVCDQEGIIWVVGHRIADRVKRTESTQLPCILRCSPVPIDDFS